MVEQITTVNFCMGTRVKIILFSQKYKGLHFNLNLTIDYNFSQYKGILKKFATDVLSLCEMQWYHKNDGSVECFRKWNRTYRQLPLKMVDSKSALFGCGWWPLLSLLMIFLYITHTKNVSLLYISSKYLYFV